MLTVIRRLTGRACPASLPFFLPSNQFHLSLHHHKGLIIWNSLKGLLQKTLLSYRLECEIFDPEMQQLFSDLTFLWLVSSMARGTARRAQAGPVLLGRC